MPPGSPEYIAYLQSWPWISVAVNVAGMVILAICWFAGARFSGPVVRDAQLGKWTLIGLATYAGLQMISALPNMLGMEFGVSTNRAQLNEQIALMG